MSNCIKCGHRKPDNSSELCSYCAASEELADLRARLAASEPPACTWTVDDNGIWDTTCGHVFQFGEAGPVENGAKYCQYCGKRLVPASEPGEGEEE